MIYEIRMSSLQPAAGSRLRRGYGGQAGGGAWALALGIPVAL